MTIEAGNTLSFFSSLNNYKVLKDKAVFALKSAPWERQKWSDIDLNILREIASFTPASSDFDREVQEKIFSLEMVKVNDVVCRLMGQKEHPGVAQLGKARIGIPTNLELDTFKRITGSSKLSEKLPSDSKSEMERFDVKSPDPEVVEQQNAQAEIQPPIVALRRPLPLVKQNLLEPNFFKGLAQSAREVLANGKPLLPYQLEIARQIVAADDAIAKSIPFSQAIFVHLGSPQLTKIIPEEVLEEGYNPLIARDRILRETILTIMEKPAEKSPTQRRSDPEVRPQNLSEEKKVARKWPSFSRTKSKSGFHNPNEFYPSSLVVPELRARLIEGAVCMKFLFPSSYKKHFNSRAKRAIVDRLLQLYFMTSHGGYTNSAALEICFKKDLEENRKAVDEVLYDISRDQTFSKMGKVPQIKFEEPPDCFKVPPFDEASTSKEFIEQLFYVKYKLAATYGTYSSEEHMVADFLLDVALMMKFLHYPFPKAAAYLFPNYHKLDPSAVKKLVHSVNTSDDRPKALKIVSDEDFERELSSVYCLQHEILFDFFVYYLESVLPRIENPEFRLVAMTIKAIDSRRKEVGFSKAWRTSFNIQGAGRIFQGNDEGNLKMLKHCLTQFSPASFLINLSNAHRSLKNESSFVELLNRAESYEVTNEMEVDFRRVVSHLCHMKMMMEKYRITWDQTTWLFLNHEALRELFDSENDLENAKEFNQYVGKIFPL